MNEEEMKKVLKDLFEECGITDEKRQNDFMEKLFYSRVLWEMLPEIKCDILNLQVIKRGNRGCVIFDGKYYYILPYEGKAFACTPDKNMILEDFTKFENDEE